MTKTGNGAKPGSKMPAAGRVMLALEHDGLHSEAVDLALRLAQSLGAELAGVLMEDINLLRAAALPFSTEIARSGGERALTSAALEQRMLYRARRLKRELERRSAMAGVPLSFHTARGIGSGAALGLRLPAAAVVFARRARGRFIARVQPEILVGDAGSAAAAVLKSFEPLLVTALPDAAIRRFPLSELERMMPSWRIRQPALLVLPGLTMEASALDALLERLSCPVLFVMS